jgi:Na+-driven multidrug efflux pump
MLAFLAAPWIPNFFKISPQAAALVTDLIRIFGLVMFVKVSNMHIIIGLLRSGGDTHMSATLELLPMWLVSIPLAAVAGLVLHLPPPLVYLVCLSEELLKYLFGLLRIRSGKWVHDLT